jgi:alkaline phosphatase D
VNRRDFIQLSGLFSLSATVANSLFDNNVYAAIDMVKNSMTFSVLQGATSESETQITVDIPKEMNVQFRLIGSDSLLLQTQQLIKISDFVGEPWATYHLFYSGLNPSEKYLFQILDSEEKVIDSRELKTLNLQNLNPRLAFISCTRDSIENTKYWDSVFNSQPDMLVLMGDNVYGDLKVDPSPVNLWRRYIEARQRISFYHRKRLIPVIATWDDHDFGFNGAIGTYQHKDESKRALNSFFGRTEIDSVYSMGPGVSSCFRGFGLQILMLDDRYFRVAKGTANGSTVGDTQMRWALQNIQEFNGPTWIIHGSVFFGGFEKRGESWENQFKPDLHNFLDGIRGTGKKVLFASGDVHHTETMTIEKELLGYESLELVSSGLHSIIHPFGSSNPRRRKISNKKGFALVQHTRADDHLVLDITAFTKSNKRRFNDKFTLGF